MYMFGMLSTLNFIFVMTIWDDIFVFFSLSHFCVVSLSTFAFFFFCFLYVNVECSLIIHLGDCHALGYHIDATFIIFATCNNVILFQSLHYWELAIYMFGILSILNFIFGNCIYDDIFVFLSLSHFCIVSMSTFVLLFFYFFIF